MGGAKRQREEYEEFLINRPPVHMNADTQANVLTMALEATRLDLEKKHVCSSKIYRQRKSDNDRETIGHASPRVHGLTTVSMPRR